MNSLPKLNLPTYNFRFQTYEEKTFIFDDFRGKYISLTPEEWVRQNFLKYLVHEKSFPKGLIGVEQLVKINQQPQRADLLIYNKAREIFVLGECKAPLVPINQKTIDQAVRYNTALKVPFLMITNGIKHYCIQIDYVGQSYKFLEDFPDYDVLTKN